MKYSIKVNEVKNGSENVRGSLKIYLILRRKNFTMSYMGTY